MYTIVTTRPIDGHHSASGQKSIDGEDDVAGQSGEDQGAAGGGHEVYSRLKYRIFINKGQLGHK